MRNRATQIFSVLLAYGQELEDAIAEGTSGALKDMLVELSYGKRDQSKTVNSQQAQTAALKLYKVN